LAKDFYAMAGSKGMEEGSFDGASAAKPHITELPITWSNWYQHVNWLNCFFVLFIPLVGCIGAIWTPLHMNTALFAIVYYFNAGLGITAGRSFSAVPAMGALKETIN
jgi:stearoyl-CoA desaturase (delta-9 desaturase)